MKYALPTETIPQNKRKEINQKVLLLIDSGRVGEQITAQDIFHAYTGEGGLHGLKTSDFSSYHAFSEEKKEIENGQFFTPPSLCKKVVDCLPIHPSDLVADLTFGSGNFFNFLPHEANAFGCEVDKKAHKVATLLYPQATLTHGDLRFYNPGVKFDFIVGNPPFNLSWKVNGHEVLSQLFFLQKASELLVPGGILAVIVPESFLSDVEFRDKNFVAVVNESYSFLCQSKLPRDAFRDLGVKSFETKLIFLQRRIEGIESHGYSTLFTPFESDFIHREFLSPALDVKDRNKHKNRFLLAAQDGVNNWSRSNSELRTSDGFEFQLRKILFELKTHPASKPSVKKALQYIQRFNEQSRPEEMSFEEWEKTKITESKVLAYCRELLRKAISPKAAASGIRAVRHRYSFELVAGDRESKQLLSAARCSAIIKKVDAIQNPDLLGKHPFSKLFQPFLRGIVLRHKRFKAQTSANAELQTVPAINAMLTSFRFIHKDGTRKALNDVQRADLNVLLQRPFGALLNWQQGGGKTVAAWAYLNFHRARVKNVFIVAPPIAVKMTWVPFLTRNAAPFRVLTSATDIECVKDGEILLISLGSKLGSLNVRLRKFIRTKSNKVLLVLDESDEITNYSSRRSRSVRSVFRRAKIKILTTGTPTRNNIAEIYGQLELLYNNSENLLCMAENTFEEKRNGEAGELVMKQNPHSGTPFPARGGYSLFKKCFSPVKSTVFGIQKHNQDVLNRKALEYLISYSVLTKKFRDIVGPDRYEVHTVTVSPKSYEVDFYQAIAERFHEMLPLYFSTTGNSKKDSMLKLIRQLRLMIQACSIPHLMHGPAAGESPQKQDTILKMVAARDTKILIGCTTRRAAHDYYSRLVEEFPDRPVSLVTGEVTSFVRRQEIIDAFEGSSNGIIVCTQQSLSSSVNIPSCNEVIIESMQWNLPKIEQFYFRTIRFDSASKSNVHFVVNRDSIEVNLLTLLLDKERLNDFVKTREFRGIEDVFGDFNIAENFIDMLLRRERDSVGRLTIQWGKQQVLA